MAGGMFKLSPNDFPSERFANQCPALCYVTFMVPALHGGNPNGAGMKIVTAAHIMAETYSV